MKALSGHDKHSHPHTHTHISRLSCPYGDVQIKDLYNQKEVESQSVNVDVLEDSKEVNGNGQSKNEPDVVLMESPKKDPPQRKEEPLKQETVLPPVVPMETESITVMASSDPSEVGQANLRTLLTKPEVDKSLYSDISDGSDTELSESKPKKPSKEAKQTTESHTVISAMNGFYPNYKIESKPNKGKETLSNLSARLPSFGEVGRPTKSSRKDEKTSSKGEEYIPDSQPSSPKEKPSKQTNSAVEVRSKLMSTYPSSSASDTSVSMPEQDKRHNRVAVASLYGSAQKQSGLAKGHDDSSHSALHTLSSVAASMIPVNNGKEKQPRHPKMTMLTQEDFKQDSGRVRRSVSPRPSSLVPKSNNRRSPSPARFSKQTLEQQAATLPSFDPVPGSQRANESGRVPSPPVIVKPGLCEWGLEASRDEDGHDSDSSGSGSLIPAVNRSKPHKSKRHNKSMLSDIKTDKSSREETGGVSETC